MATVVGPLLRASGAALANATGSTLAMARRLSSSSGVAVFARELLLGSASAGSAVEVVGVARNAAGRVGYGSVAFRVGAGASSALRVRASVSGASAGTAGRHGDALSISASADASLCGGAKALSLSGSPSWSLRLVGLAPLNSSWSLPAVSVADLGAALQRAWSKRASPARWSVAGGTLPAGHSAEFEVSATAAVASGGAALQTLSGSARAQVSVSATAGLSALLSSSSGSEIGGSEGSAVVATVRDLDGLGALRALCWSGAQVGGSSAGAGRTVLLSWSLRDASSASLVPAFTDDCALAAGQTLWSLLPSGLRVAAGGASVATQAWSPAAPSAFLASLRNVSAAMAGGADASAAATVQSWSLSPASGSSSASAVDSLVSPAAGSSSGSSRSVTACALRSSALYEVEVRAVRPSDGAEGSAVLRIRTSARPSGGLLAVSATSTDAGPATGPWSSSLAVAVPALAAGSVAFEARGLAGAVSVSFVAFKPTVAAAEALAASPSSAQARLDAVMGAQRTVLSSGVSAQSPTVALPVGAGEWGVLVIGAVAQSADGGVSVSLSAASGGALLVQAMSPVAVHAARDLSDEVLVASQLGNASTDDASASVAAAAALIWNSSSADGGIAASAADALALGDTEGALSRVAGAASLLGAVSASQSQSASKCARELILLGEDGATGPHASCSGRGRCSLSGQAPECAAVLARAIGATANADDRRAAASAGEQELADAGCRASCVCPAGRKGSACGLSEAASAAQGAAMGSLLRVLHGAATQAGDGSSADQLASAASGVQAAVSGDPEGVDGASAGLALDTLETLSAVSAASSREGGGNETTGSIPAELASHVCSALSGLLASGGFVSAGGSYADGTVTISAAGVTAGAGLAEQAGAGVGAVAAGGGGTLVTAAWSRGTSPFAAAAAAARLQEAADAARAAAVSRADAASNASLGDSQLDSGTAAAAMAVSAASSVGQVTEVTMLVPAGGGAQADLESGVAALLADEGCLARGGANGSLAATYGVDVAAGQSAAAGLVTASPALGVASPHVRCLREPLLLRLPLPAGMTAADFVPRWWSEETGSWATGGVVVLSVDEASRTAVVATTHLTGFAATAEAVLARVRLPSLSRDVGRLRNYLRPENALPALVIGGIVLAFAIAWVVAWRYDQADRTRARYMAARRALVLAYGFTGVPTHEQARSFKRLQRLRRLEEQGLRRKLRRARRQREAGGQVVPGESHGGARNSTTSRSARRGSVAAAGGGAAAQVDGAWFNDPRSAPAAEPRSSTRESSALSQYSRWVCQLFMMKLRSDHPLSFCTAPPEALVTFTRTQRVLVLCVLWILSMSVAAAFFGKQPASIEVRAGVVLLSALCMLPATFLLPFVFRYVSSLRSVTATVGSRAPAMREWASAVASTDRSAGAAKPGRGRSSVPAVGGAGGNDDGSDSDSEGSVAFRPAMSIEPPMEPDVTAIDSPCVVSPIRPAEAARREKDFVLLTNLHADVILKFSPYLRGPPGSSATAARIASYFTVWCGLALVGAAAVFAVSAEGYPGKDTGLTPRSVCFLGLGVAAMGALALLLIRRAGVAARSAAKHGHQVFLAAAAKRRTPLERRRRDSQLGADTASRRFQGGRAAGGGAGAAVAEGVVTKSALEASAGKALRSAYRRAGCCGCLGGAWLVGAGIVLGSVYIGQVVAAVLFVMLLDSPLALEACLTIAGLEGALLVSVAGVLVFLWWDARRAHSRALVIAFEGGGVNRLLRAQVEEELRRRHRRQALMDAKAADAAVLSVTRRAMRGPRMVLDAAGVEIIVARLWTSRLVKPAPSGGSVLPPALRRFQAAAATVLVRDVLGRHLEDAGVLEASSRRSSVSAGRASGLGSPSGAESGSFVSGSARPIARLAWRQMEEECAVQIQAAWRGHIGRRSALRMYELQVWEEDLALERGCLTGLVYAVAMLLLGAGTFICLVFGVLFTPEQARVWLLTSLASFALDLLVQKPVVIFCNAVALTVWGACTGRTASWANVSPNFVGAGGAWMGVL
ncbi:hypothetical protein FNF28_02111 [Cafeteria roenbergensis]|uniref:Uncharacterized protein n=1 Tax=Cafeteria roenbergensis TaxID=33653 RepID=A0A5A8DWB0_CAFRO|nr:hypothetical protein FNF28_02111 [Cafeteria roenbergensis]